MQQDQREMVITKPVYYQSIPSYYHSEMAKVFFLLKLYDDLTIMEM